MQIGDKVVSIDDAHGLVQDYARDHAATLEIFDGVGDGGYQDEQPDRVTLADIGRLVVINAQLQADDVPTLLSIGASEAFAEVPLTASLEEVQHGEATWQAATSLYDLFRSHTGIARAKRSKLLHAKRPGMFFISDSRTSAAYESAAESIARERGREAPAYWEAAQRDIMQDEFVELMSRMSETFVESLPGRPHLGNLSRLRVLDIVCWAR